MKKHLLLFTLILFMGFTQVGWGQGTENFTNLPTTSASSYLARSWTGTDGVTWTAALARTDQTLNSKSICWGNSGTRNVISPSYNNGIGTLQFNYVRAFTGTGLRSLEVYVNSVLQASITVSPTSDVVVAFSQVINVTGSVIVEVRSTGAAQVKVDDISWDAYSGSLPTVTVSAYSLTNYGSVTTGSSSAEQSYTVSGSNLTNDIVVTPPTDFEISQTSGSGFATSDITLTQTGGTVNTTTIYARFTPLSTGVKSGNIANVSTGATTQNVAVGGIGTNSNTSDIIENIGFTYPTNIAYTTYQNANIVGDAGDIEVAQFTIRDGGGAGDVDEFGTILTAITFTLTNYSNVRSIALYDGVTEVGTETAGATSVSFSGLTLTAADAGTKDFSVRVSFNTVVTDNQQIQLTVTSASYDAAGSAFATASAGGAVSSIDVDNNRIEVTATQLVYTTSKPPASVYVNAGFNVEVKAKDANSNTDLDATNSATLTRSTGTGVLSSATGLTQSLSAGVYSWIDVAYNTLESFAITASASGLTDAVSSSISCQSVPVATHVVIAEIYGGGGNTGAPYTSDYIVLYNPTGSAVDVSTWSVQYASSSSTTATWSVTPLTGSISANSYYLIQEAVGAIGSALPVTPNVIGSISMGSTGGKIVLANTTTAFAVQQPSGASVVDLVGYGSANGYEGTGPTSATSNTSSVRRKSNTGTSTYGSGNGCDSDDNSFDFYVETDLVTNAPLPVELTSFSASAQNKTVNLTWKTATEVNNYGFEIERVKDLGDKVSVVSVWEKVGFVNGAGNSNSPKEYSFTDKSATSGKYLYRLKQLDNDGQYTYSKEVEVDLGTPTAFALEQNYPNPFNPTTSMQYSVSSKQFVTIKVFDMLGREVAILVNGEKEPGTYTTEFATTGLASGTYIYRMQSGEFVQTKKMVILK